MHSTHSSSRILLPARWGFVLFSLLVMFVLNFMCSNAPSWTPDWVALALIFWSVREPRFVGMGLAFVSGLFMDVVAASVMGQHALAYVCVSYVSFLLSRRLLRFPLRWQALHVLPLLLGAQLTQYGVCLFFGARFPGAAYFIGPFIGAALWLPLAHLLLLPQYQPIERDENRPL